MQAYGNIMKRLLSPYSSFRLIPTAGVKSMTVPTPLKDIEFPERVKLRIVNKVPQYPPGTRPFKMQKKLRLMRGPELKHNTLLHKQYGVMATGGGRLKYSNFEMIRFMLIRNIDYNVAFAIWRVPDPWQPITKKSPGSRMGAGKGAIDHYVTPVKAGQIIFEVGGNIEFFEVKYVLHNIASRLPFTAMVVSQEKLEKMAEEKKRIEEENLNPYTWKYIIQNDLLSSQKWISKYDRRWYNEYL
ncbi:large ribosomal subunit protein uL16m isoform X1 [Megachile rotundata]|uniref:large ribosomal subunit protein uL16m isoform X1 n=2 Tax=Megachile rotundata TaxID=143995 RepID=UPI003FCF20E3